MSKEGAPDPRSDTRYPQFERGPNRDVAETDHNQASGDQPPHPPIERPIPSVVERGENFVGYSDGIVRLYDPISGTDVEAE